MKPLFKIDDDGESKSSRILEHSYTKACLEVFKNSTKDLVVYGNSLSDQDSPLVNVIKEKFKNKNFKVFVSV